MLSKSCVPVVPSPSFVAVRERGGERGGDGRQGAEPERRGGWKAERPVSLTPSFCLRPSAPPLRALRPSPTLASRRRHPSRRARTPTLVPLVNTSFRDPSSPPPIHSLSFPTVASSHALPRRCGPLSRRRLRGLRGLNQRHAIPALQHRQGHLPGGPQRGGEFSEREGEGRTRKETRAQGVRAGLAGLAGARSLARGLRGRQGGRSAPRLLHAWLLHTYATPSQGCAWAGGGGEGARWAPPLSLLGIPRKSVGRGACGERETHSPPHSPSRARGRAFTWPGA